MPASVDCEPTERGQARLDGGERHGDEFDVELAVARAAAEDARIERTGSAVKGVCRSISNDTTSRRRSAAAAGNARRRRRPAAAGNTSQRGRSAIDGPSTAASGSSSMPRSVARGQEAEVAR